MHTVLLIDMTEHNNDMVVVLNGKVIYAEDYGDGDVRNDIYDATSVAQATADALGVPLVTLEAPPFRAEDWTYDDAVEWAMAKVRGIDPPVRPGDE